MDQDPKDRSTSRESMLAVALVVLVGGIILFFLYFISFGVVGNVLIGAGIIVVIGAFHYLAWGRALSEEVAAERDALKRKESSGTHTARAKAPPGAIQDMSRTQGIQE
jgi:hypothetical protein